MLVDLMFDFTKAFDVVSDCYLGSSLWELCILLCCGWRLFWWDVQCALHAGESLSISGEVSSGVPQGSALRPLLLIIYVNFITDKY